MGLIRLVIFALVIWLVWRMIKNYQASQARRKNSGNQKLTSGNMVACHYCSVHVPENDAIAHEQLWFCSESHKDKFLAGNQ